MAYKFELTKDRSAVNGKYTFTFVGNSHKAVVPVLQHRQSGEYRIIGTGFYLIRPNIFITAAHIFKGNDINDDDSFSVLLEDAPDPIPLTHKYNHESLDIAFFILDSTSLDYLEDVNPLAVMNMLPTKNEVVAIFGYSHSDVDPMNKCEIDDGEAMQNTILRSKWELGGVLGIHDSGRGFVKGQCFETSVLAEGRDSGAPMFNGNGFVIGLLSRSFKFESGLPNSTCTSILQIGDIPIDGKPIRELWNRKHRTAFCKQNWQ